MKTIKFRVWDKLEKRFIYPDEGYQGHYVLDLNGRFHNLQNGSGGDEYVVQQYTGVKDIYIKEIYEGDIIEFETEAKKYNGLVAWVTGAFIILGNTMDEDKTVTHILLKDLDVFNYKVRVIGDSFEDPELLKQ